ncbi:MAG: hypothetical protein JWM59_2753 [Verrucomicrobiales bacterium]|nr:hypothetical protein [Verrucomicrobiales bacterium]
MTFLKSYHPTRRAVCRWSFLAALGAAGPGALTARGQAQGPSLRTAMERVYLDWMQAVSHKDAVRWGAATSRYRQMCLRNQVVSLKQPWPQAVFRSFFRAPQIGRLRFVDASAAGPVGRLVYFGQVDFGFVDGEVTPENPLMLYFLKEDGGWKFNTLQYVNLSGDEALKRDIRAGGKEWLNRPDFAMDPRPPAMPKPCPEPYQVATISVLANGCRVTVEVNDGLHQETVENTSADHVIIGGLRKGANKVTVYPLPSAIGQNGPSDLRIRVMAKTGNPQAPHALLLNWKIPPAPWKSSYELSVFLKSAYSVGGP